MGDREGIDEVKVRPLTPMRRRVLYLTICGYTYAQIADMIGTTARNVRSQMWEINHNVLPGLGNPDGQSRATRIAYTIGLLDAGVSPDDIPLYIRRLEQRALPPAYTEGHTHGAQHVQHDARNMPGSDAP